MSRGNQQRYRYEVMYNRKSKPKKLFKYLEKTKVEAILNLAPKSPNTYPATLAIALGSTSI